jgi:putative membrane-bound dehydrogenase-like protein
MSKKPARSLPVCAPILAVSLCCSGWPGLFAQDATTPAAKEQTEEPGLVPTDRFSVPDGLEVTVWATTPQLHNPTNIDFDSRGRLWVAEGVNYRIHSKRQPEGDRIVVLEDTDGDGRADRSHVFVQEPGLIAPLGIAVFENKVVVSQPPDLLVYTDVNEDGKFDPAMDKKETLLTGFNGQNHDHSLHSVTAGPDGKWYWNQGNTGAQFTDKSGRTFRMGSAYMVADIAGQKSDDGHVWIGGFAAKMNPDGSGLSIIGHNFRNSYEQAVTSLGDVFQSDNDDPPACRVTAVMEGGNAGFCSADGKRLWKADQRPGQAKPIAEWRQEDPGTMPAGDVYGGGSPTGVAFYENGALGDKWQGLLLACEAGKNVIFGYFPKPAGADWKLERFDFLTSNKEKEFAGSDFLGGKPSGELKTKFRPSDVAVGPDGALYVADWFDARVGGHQTLDDACRGTIYRIAPKGFKSRVPKLDLTSTEGQILALQSPAVNVRHSGFLRLRAQGAKAVAPVAGLLGHSNPYVAARATWLLAQMGDAGVGRVKPLLKSSSESARLVAYRALRAAGQDVVSLASFIAEDPSPAVRREASLSLRDAPAEQAVPILAKIGSQFDGSDRAYLEALGLGSEGKEELVYEELQKSMGGAPEKWSDAFAGIAWRLHPTAAAEAIKARALSPSVTPDQRKQMLTALGFVASRAGSSAMLELAAAPAFPAKTAAVWWLLHNNQSLWRDHDLGPALKASGAYDPDKLELVSVEPPPPSQGGSEMPSAREIAALAGDAARGQSAGAVCLMCHSIGDRGVDFGPNLTAFGAQQTKEVIAQAIATPSADIAHGFEGHVVKTKDGKTIYGMIVSTGDPVMIQSAGGMFQTVPAVRIASTEKLKTSLMYEPSQLGLDAQKIADIIAWLQELPSSGKAASR